MISAWCTNRHSLSLSLSLSFSLFDRAMADYEGGYGCAVGLLTYDCFDNIEEFVQEAINSGHDFVATPIVHSKYSRVLESKAGDSWRDAPVYDRDDLVLRKARKHRHDLNLTSKD